MKLLKLLLIATIISPVVLSSCSEPSLDITLKTEADSMSYALGVNLSEQFKQGDIGDINALALAKGLSEGMDDKGSMTHDEAMEYLNSYFSRLSEQQAEANRIEGEEFLEENATLSGVEVDESGLQYKVLVEGDGPKPKPEDMVKVHYHGTLIDGTVFDSSVDRGEPAQFRLNNVIQGWQIGLQKMSVGSKYMLYIPSDLAYGATPRQGGPIKPNMMLIFEVELIDIIE